MSSVSGHLAVENSRGNGTQTGVIPVGVMVQYTCLCVTAAEGDK